MICEYCDVGDYIGYCTCQKDGNICPFMRRCNIEHKWLPLQQMQRCRLKMEETEVKILGMNEYKVAFEKRGKLYIEKDGYIVKMDNPYDYVPSTVEMVVVDGEMYIKDFAPEPKKVEKTDEIVMDKSKLSRKKTKKKDK